MQFTCTTNIALPQLISCGDLATWTDILQPDSHRPRPFILCWKGNQGLLNISEYLSNRKVKLDQIEDGVVNLNPRETWYWDSRRESCANEGFQGVSSFCGRLLLICGRPGDCNISAVEWNPCSVGTRDAKCVYTLPHVLQVLLQIWFHQSRNNVLWSSLWRLQFGGRERRDRFVTFWTK